MTIDIPLASKVMDHIAAHPDEHMQSDWIVSGPDLHIAILVNLRMKFYADHERIASDAELQDLARQAKTLEPECGTAACFAGHAVLMAGHRIDPQCDAVVIDDGPMVEYQSIRDTAADLLGLTWWEAERLFAAHNTIDDLWGILAEYSGGEIAKPEAG
jgi:hypothetical protein